jgi:hypothetical protein
VQAELLLLEVLVERAVLRVLVELHMLEVLLVQTEQLPLRVEELLRTFLMRQEVLLRRVVMLVQQEMVEQEVQAIVVPPQLQLRVEAWEQQVREALHTQEDLPELMVRPELF